MSKLVELRERQHAIVIELGDLQRKEERTADDETTIDARLAELNDITPQLHREERIEEAARTKTAERGTRASQGGQREERTEKRPDIDRRSLGRKFVDEGELDAYLKRGAKGSSTPVEVGSFWEPHRRGAILEHSADMSPDELRALIYGSALPADFVRPDVVPGIFRAGEPVSGIRSALLNGTTMSDAVISISESGFTNNAAEVLETTDYEAVSDGLKPESAITFTQVSDPVETVAHWIPITRQTLADAAQMQTYVSGRLIDGLNRRISNQLINGNGTSPNLSGILDRGSIQVADDTYFGTNPVQGAGSDNENLERIRRAKRLVRTTAHANPTFVALNPADLEVFETLTTTDGNYLLGNMSAGTGIASLWGLRVIEDEYVTAGTALVGDGSMACVWDRMQSQVFVADQHADFFIRNVLVLLAETRLALSVFRPAAFVDVTLAS